MKKIVCIMATCGRHTCVERSLRMFLDQDYENKHLIIFQNSEVEQRLGYYMSSDPNLSPYPNITLVNNSGPFTSLGHIYTEAIKHVPKDTDLVTFWDDDDLFLPNHISEGVKGYERGIKWSIERNGVKTIKAYKPEKSYYRHSGGIELMNNTLEPSIFVEKDHILEHGFSDTTTEQHLKWVHPLVYENQIFVDPKGIPTLIYNWGDTDTFTYKTSGDYNNPNNFQNCRAFSRDHGDGILTPISKEKIQVYYNLIKNGKTT